MPLLQLPVRVVVRYYGLLVDARTLDMTIRVRLTNVVATSVERPRPLQAVEHPV